MKEQVPKRRAGRLGRVGIAGVALGVIATMGLLNRSQAPGTHDFDQPAQSEQAADAAASQRIADMAASRRPREASVRNRATNRYPESAEAPAVATVDVRRDESPIRHATDEKDAEGKLIASNANAVSRVPPSGLEPPPVTITGCLEMSTSGDEFRLAETEGADAPTSRNWRMGFLKKRTTPVALVEAPDGPPLKASVGKRVEATGLLASRQLTVSRLRVVGDSCD